MIERHRSHLPLRLANPTQALGLARVAGSKFKESALRLLPGFSRELPRVVQRADRASRVDTDGFPSFTGGNGGWACSEYGDYYATSVPVYSAIRLRADALSQAQQSLMPYSMRLLRITRSRTQSTRER